MFSVVAWRKREKREGEKMHDSKEITWWPLTEEKSTCGFNAAELLSSKEGKNELKSCNIGVLPRDRAAAGCCYLRTLAPPPGRGWCWFGVRKVRLLLGLSWLFRAVAEQRSCCWCWEAPDWFRSPASHTQCFKMLITRLSLTYLRDISFHLNLYNFPVDNTILLLRFGKLPKCGIF